MGGVDLIEGSGYDYTGKQMGSKLANSGMETGKKGGRN